MTGDATEPAHDDDLVRKQLQVAANQSIFRETNENLEALNQRFSEVVPVGDFVCECGSTECTKRIGLTIAEYEEVRRHPARFAVRPGHVFPDVERVVEERPGYTIVEKFGAAGTYAARVDPRAN